MWVWSIKAPNHSSESPLKNKSRVGVQTKCKVPYTAYIIKEIDINKLEKITTFVKDVRRYDCCK